jgi:hypothetical protein
MKKEQEFYPDLMTAYDELRQVQQDIQGILYVNAGQFIIKSDRIIYAIEYSKNNGYYIQKYQPK